MGRPQREPPRRGRLVIGRGLALVTIVAAIGALGSAAVDAFIRYVFGDAASEARPPERLVEGKWGLLPHAEAGRAQLHAPSGGPRAADHRIA